MSGAKPGGQQEGDSKPGGQQTGGARKGGRKKAISGEGVPDKPGPGKTRSDEGGSGEARPRKTSRDMTTSNKARRRRLRLWIPQYHGGWAMVIVPPIMGIVEGGFRPAHVPLFLLWFVGYFLFYCATVWLRSHGKRRYFPPVRVYGLAVAALGLITLACAPYLWRWGLVYAPLIAFAGWAAFRRDERSLASGLDTVAAACLMVPVTWDVSTGGKAGLLAPGHVWVLAAMFFGYFAGTVFYVKTNIRKRKSNGYLAASIGWHLAWAVAATVLAWRDAVSLWHVAVWIALAARAIAVPLRGRAGKPASVAAIGVGEILSCLVVTASLF